MLVAGLLHAYDLAEDGYGSWEEQSYQENAFDFALPTTEDEPADSFNMRIQRMTHHELRGKASSDFGKLKFKSRLFANNDVRFSLFIDDDGKDLEFQGYIDLVNETMELDGAGAVLTPSHRNILEKTSGQLGALLSEKFDNELPVHGFMLVQMMSYWSKSPANFEHGKRTVKAGH